MSLFRYWWCYLVALSVVMGIVLSPLRAVAATIPVLAAYDEAARPTATTVLGEHDAVRPDAEHPSVNAYDAARLGLRRSLERARRRGHGSSRPYDGNPEDAHQREPRPEEAIYAAAAPAPAAEGTVGVMPALRAGADLAKQLASEAQLGEMAAGAGRPIAGPGTDTVFRDAPRIAQTYEGNAADWAKMSSSGFRAADGTTFATHWVENVVTGAQAEAKVVIDVFGGP